jgi:hypothetical protein
MRTGLIAAGLALLLAASLLATGGRANATVAHTCSATDRQFIRKVELNMASLGFFSEQYRNGEATEQEVVAEARKAARRIEKLNPSDPSLQKTRSLVAAMFVAYGRAMEAKAADEDAGPHMYRAYGLANFAYNVLTEAAPGLRRHGCDVSPLL